MGDGGGRRGHRRLRGGRTSSNDGGIFTTGFHTNNADFGNQYSAQNLQPTYGQQQQQPQYGGGQSQYQGGRGNGQAQYGGGGQAQYGGAQDDNIAMLEKAVPGIPGEDYPIYAEVPETSFSCDGQVDGGYYGDPQAECQVFHICTNDGQGGLSRYSFLCPNGTIFNQEYFICDWWFNFDCSEAEAFYSLNEEIAAEREAATQALLSAAASNGQATYVSQSSSNSYASPSSSSYGAASASASSGGYSAPSSASYSGPNGGGRQGGNGRRKNNNRGKKGGKRRPAAAGNSRRNNNSYSAPVSQNYGAPSQSPSSGYSSASSSGYGAPTSQAASTNYAAPASNGYSAASSSSYGSPDYSDDLPSYGRKK